MDLVLNGVLLSSVSIVSSLEDFSFATTGGTFKRSSSALKVNINWLIYPKQLSVRIIMGFFMNTK
jgi:hypothetical protein